MIRELSSGKWPRLLDGSGHKWEFFLQLFQDFDSLSEGGHLIGGRLMEGKL